MSETDDQIYGARREQARQQAAAQAHKQLDDEAAAARDRFVTAAEKAAAINAKNPMPGVTDDTYRQIIKIYDKNFKKFRAEIDDAHLKAPTREWLGADITAAKQEASNNMSKDIARIDPKGRSGDRAWMSIGQAAQGDGFFTPVIKEVYDSDKGGILGGLQLGGVAGLLGGAFIAHKLTEPYGPILNWVLTAVGGLGLAYLAHKYIDAPDTPLKTPDFHNVAQSKGKAPTKQVAVAENKSQAPVNNKTSISDDERQKTEALQKILGDAPLSGHGVKQASLSTENQGLNPGSTPIVAKNTQQQGMKTTQKNTYIT